jgi:hypothetical protein
VIERDGLDAPCDGVEVGLAARGAREVVLQLLRFLRPGLIRLGERQLPRDRGPRA